MIYAMNDLHVLLEKAKEVAGKGARIDLVVNLYTMQICFISKIMADRIGYTPEELCGKSARTIVPIDQRMLGQVASKMTDPTKEDTRELKHKDGHIVQSTAQLQSFSYEDEVYLVVMNARPPEEA